jgi:hypothetical protein
MDSATAGLIGATLAGFVALIGTVRGGRSEEIKNLWAENRARAADARQEREDRQALERAFRADLAASEERCTQQMAELHAECQRREEALEVRIAALGGA